MVWIKNSVNTNLLRKSISLGKAVQDFFFVADLSKNCSFLSMYYVCDGLVLKFEWLNKKRIWSPFKSVTGDLDIVLTPSPQLNNECLKCVCDMVDKYQQNKDICDFCSSNILKKKGQLSFYRFLINSFFQIISELATPSDVLHRYLDRSGDLRLFLLI